MHARDEACLGRWLGGLAQSTGQVNRPLIEKFLAFCGVGAGEAVEFQHGSPGDYRFVDEAYKWLEQNQNLSVSTMETRMGVIRGFFLANRAALPKDKHRFHSDKEPVIGELTVPEFRKILFSCNIKYRPAFLVQFHSGSGRGELEYINTHHAEHIWKEVKRDRRIIRLTMPGRKSNRNRKPYYTFIGGDAVDALRRLFHSQGWKKPDVLFEDQFGKPVSTKAFSRYFKKHAIKAGVITQKTWPCLDCGGETVKRIRNYDGSVRTYYICTACHVRHGADEYDVAEKDWGGIRYRVRTHELRDLFRTQWHRAQRYAGVDPDDGEFHLGHTIDPDKYDKIMNDVSEARRQYRLALPWLNVLSEEPDKLSRTEVDEELAAQNAKVEVLSRELAEVKRLLQSPELLAHLRRVAEDE